ncbi:MULTISPECIES: methyltransferase domain-containing protein [Streptomyces]|uniref:methyltransferase domain-containing protein n=1 Tax=Streptomyces TaxID=1883 RepID=UPI0033E1091E
MALAVREEWSALGHSLQESDAMSPEWMPSFLAVPRSAFLPEVFWPFDMDTGKVMEVDRRTAPEEWESFASADMPLVTQWDDGKGHGPGKMPTSSASMPTVVVRMLGDLDAQPGHRVLEIGTGTGWNAALLAHRLGPDRVVTIEIDSNVATAARDRLAAAGLLGTVLTRDGALGDPAGAPYDRIIATAGLRQIPGAWLEQVRDRGVIVAPWGTHFGNEDAIVRLTVTADGASGPFTRAAEFMKVRAQRLAFDGHSAYVPDGVGGASRSTTEVTEAELLGSGRFEARTFALGLRVPDCHCTVADKRDGARPVWFFGLTDRSWACVMFRDGRQTTVWQSGDREVWHEVTAALRWWQDAGEPGYDRFGLTVTKDGAQHAWLDTPENSWPV